MQHMLIGLCLLLCGLAGNLHAQTVLPLHHRQGFSIRNLQVTTNDIYQSKRHISLQFDCAFRYPIKDLSAARYKFYASITNSQGNLAYNNPKNYVAALATESISQPGQSIAEGLILRIPIEELQLAAGKHELTIHLHAMSGDFEQPKTFENLARKNVSLEVKPPVKLDFEQQSFQIERILLQADSKSGTKGFSLHFRLQAAHSYESFLADDRPAEAGTFLVGVEIYDSSHRMIYATIDADRWYERFARIKPIAKPQLNNQLIEDIELFVPYERLQATPGNHQVTTHVVIYNFDRSHRYEAGQQNMLIYKPRMFTFNEQQVKLKKLHTNHYQQEIQALQVQTEGAFQFGSELISGSGQNPSLVYACLYATLEDQKGQLLYEPHLPPATYQQQSAPYHYLIASPYGEELDFSGSWLIPFKEIDLPEGEHEVWLVVHMTDLEGKIHKKQLHRQLIRLQQPLRHKMQINQSEIILRPLQQWASERQSIPDYLRYRRQRLPNLRIRLWVGKEMVYESKAYVEASQLPAHTIYAYLCTGDQVEWQLTHEEPGSGVLLLARQSLSSNDGTLPLEKGICQSGRLQWQSVPTLAIMARELWIAPTNYQSVEGYEVGLRLRMRYFDTAHSLLFVEYTDSSRTLRKPIPYIHLLKGQARIHPSGFLLESAVGEWSFFLPYYAIQDGQMIRVAVQDLNTRQLQAIMSLPLPEQTPTTQAVQVSLLDLRQQRIRSIPYVVLRLAYHVPEILFSDWGTTLRFHYDLQQQNQSLRSLVMQTQPVSEDGSFRPTLAQGYLEIYLPEAELCQQLQDEDLILHWSSNIPHEKAQSLSISRQAVCSSSIAAPTTGQ